jgi:hypothetical protein
MVVLGQRSRRTAKRQHSGPNNLSLRHSDFSFVGSEIMKFSVLSLAVAPKGVNRSANY